MHIVMRVRRHAYLDQTLEPLKHAERERLRLATGSGLAGHIE